MSFFKYITLLRMIKCSIPTVIIKNIDFLTTCDLFKMIFLNYRPCVLKSCKDYQNQDKNVSKIRYCMPLHVMVDQGACGKFFCLHSLLIVQSRSLILVLFCFGGPPQPHIPIEVTFQTSAVFSRFIQCIVSDQYKRIKYMRGKCFCRYCHHYLI